MAVYTFYLCNRGGAAISLEAFALGSDAEAPERALKMLKEHPSCSYIAVWDDERPVLESYRSAGARQGEAPVNNL